MSFPNLRSVGGKTFYFLCSFVFLLASKAYSMDWNDEEWSRSNCPGNVLGQWISESHSPSAGSRMTVKPHAVLINFEDGRVVEFRYTRTPQSAKDKRFIELKISHAAKEGGHPRFLRIRPHLVIHFKKPASDGIDPPQCLIKVFRYASGMDIDLNRNLNWDIYRKAR